MQLALKAFRGLTVSSTVGWLPVYRALGSTRDAMVLRLAALHRFVLRNVLEPLAGELA